MSVVSRRVARARRVRALVRASAFVVTFDPRPVRAAGQLAGLRRMSLADARRLAAFAAPRTGRIVHVETLEGSA